MASELVTNLLDAFDELAGGVHPVSGRFRLRPEAGTEFLTPEEAAKKTADFLAAEMSERLVRGPAGFRVLVQLAEAGEVVTDSTVLWPETRQEVEFGTLAITRRVESWPLSGGRLSSTQSPEWMASTRRATRSLRCGQSLSPLP
jgi:hypothetical protein